jgi:ABC transport system ATP-binding/permease protein
VAGIEREELAVGNQVAHGAEGVPPLLARTVRNTHRLESGREYRIGRDDSADIALIDARASWNHAVIRAEGPVWVLEDAGSRNGTFLGSQRVNRLEITGPCVVHFGHPEDGPVMSFEFAAAPQAAAAAPPAPSVSPVHPVPPAPSAPPAPPVSPAPSASPQGYGAAQSHGAAQGSPGYGAAQGSPGYGAAQGYGAPAGNGNGAPPQGRYGQHGYGQPPTPASAQPSSGDTTFLPGVLREPTSRIRIQAQVMKIGRRPDNDIVVHDLGVSKQHAELRRSATGRFTIIDLASHNGTYVNGTRIHEQELSEDDIIAIGHATYRLVGGELVEYVDDGRATFEAHELQVVVHDGGKQKILLDGITFPLAERSMMAVIGPAGAGKSTLLNALTGKRPATTGNVFYDFRDLYENYDELRHRIGLVPQESVTHDQLTAQSALGYQAELRFPSDTGADERSQRVGEVLSELSMTRHKDTRIDRLSGGQKKRVNIGLELLTRPSLLFLDEPTSPLDPHLKRQMFEQMRVMADPDSSTGQSVVVITHDVESKLIGLCDRLIVLQPGGKMAYFGPPTEGLKYFGKDDWADVFQGFEDYPDRDWSGEYKASPEYRKYVDMPISVRQGRLDAGRPEGENVKPKQRSSFDQIFTMARRYRRVMAADRVFIATAALMPILLGLLVRATPDKFGLVDSVNPPGFNVNALQSIMILVMSSVLSGTALSIREFIKERDIYERERMAGLSATAYLLSKVLVLTLVSVLQTLLVVAVGLIGVKVPSKGVVIPVTSLVEIFVALAVLSVVSMLIGLAISTLVTKGDQTMPILVGVTMVQVALSGGLFPVAGALNAISFIAPARWGLAAFASTVNLNKIQASLNTSQGGMPATQQPDLLWTSNAAHWGTAIGVMIGLGIIWMIVARLRLATIGPRKRK